MMNAIIPAAGLGTRFLPATRAVPKEMLPIGARPALDIIVDEARAAGAEKTVIVISRAKELIRRYFEDAPDVAFAYQEEQRGLGHAVLQAAEAAGGGAPGRTLVLLGDALVAGCNASSLLAETSAANGGASAVLLEHVPRERISRYGIAAPRGAVPPGPGPLRIDGIVEKPSPEEAPSDLAVAGRYLLDNAIFGFLATQAPGLKGEIQLTDAIRRMAAGRPLYGYVSPGRRLDIGNPDGYFEALCAFREAAAKGE